MCGKGVVSTGTRRQDRRTLLHRFVFLAAVTAKGSETNADRFKKPNHIHPAFAVTREGFADVCDSEIGCVNAHSSERRRHQLIFR